MQTLGHKACALAGLPVIVEACGAHQVHAVVVPTVHEQVGVQEAGVHHMSARQKAPVLQRAWIWGVAELSAVGPGVVSMGVIRCGRSSSQVSVMCTVSPTHGLVCLRA